MIERLFESSGEISPIEQHLADLFETYGLTRRPDLRITSQVPIWDPERPDWPRYILDFVIDAPSGVMVNVECDGEEWHTDKVYDAARDDYVRSIGYGAVVRFTGTEIYRAGLEIVAYLDVLVWALVNRGRGYPAWIAQYLVKPTARQKPDGSYEAYLPVAGTRL